MMHVGSVPYLNGRPLIHGLDNEPEIELLQEVPSRLAILLREGVLTAGLVSSVACFQNPSLQIIPDISISCNGPVQSVKLFYTGDLSDIQKVALDTSSLTSVTLIKVILSEGYGLNPEFLSMPPVLPAMLHACDAGVVIGDNAMRVPAGRWSELDLGYEWHKLTGLPFVFAVWAVNPALADPSITEILQRSKKGGLKSIDEISKSEAQRLDLPVNTCHNYLSNIMDYSLTDHHIDALRLFRKKIIELGIIPDAHMPEIYQPLKDQSPV
ncbi:MAG: menaquinone biosynthetic enzyme MqnA/MqnD family protein [Armatimonadota bacterium]